MGSVSESGEEPTADANRASGGGTAFVTGASGFVGGALTRSLIDDGWTVRALARSSEAGKRVSELGATPVPGDLGDRQAIVNGAAGCELAFHSAAVAGSWAEPELLRRANVEGTANALAGCAAAGAKRFVHVGTEAALTAGGPLVEVDESAPLRPDSPIAYSATKARAEELVRAASKQGFETVVVRPRLIWGPGDTGFLPELLEAVESGRFAWINGGEHRTSTSHIDNVVHGLRLAAESGRAGGVYFVTDGEPVVFREFVTDLLATEGATPPERSVPRPLARAAAATAEGLWGRLPLPGDPPLSRLAVWLASAEATLKIDRARVELGYEPVCSPAEGLAELGG